ncbi:hypothetical protein RFI_33535, partial [Reticulomyxa filosa]
MDDYINGNESAAMSSNNRDATKEDMGLEWYSELDDCWCEDLKGELLRIDDSNPKVISKSERKPHWSSCYGKGLISQRTLEDKGVTVQWCVQIERLFQGRNLKTNNNASKYDSPQITIGLSSDLTAQAKLHCNGNFSRYNGGIGIDNLGFVSQGYEPMLHSDKSVAYQEGDQ